MSANTPTTPRREDANLTLARAMGAKSYNPLPPAQHEWQVSDDKPLHRMWSAMCAATIAHGRRSPFAVSERQKDRNGEYIPGTGTPLTLEDIATMAGIHDKGLASRIWEEGEEMGIWRRDGNRRKDFRYCLCGNVSKAQIAEAKKRRVVDCTVNLTKNELKKINNLPKQDREAFFAAWEPAQQLRKDLAAAAMAEVRATCDALDDTILRLAKIERERVQREPRPKVEIPQMLLEFVQSTTIEVTVQAESVDSTTGENRGEDETVRSTHIRNQRTTSENSASSSSVPSPPRSDDDDARAFLETTIGLDKKAARQLLAGCRRSEPTITPPEVVALWTHKRDQFARKKNIGNFIGLMIHSVIEAAGGAPLAAAREALARQAAHRRLVEQQEHEANAEILRIAGEIMNDPEAGENEKDWAREVLGTRSRTAGGGT